MRSITYCQECEHCFKNKRSKTGYSCSVWGYDDFACDTVPDGFCHKAKDKNNGYHMGLSKLHKFETASEAMEFINELKRICEWYGVATRGDYLELLNHPAGKTSYKEGWLYDHIEKFKVVKAGDGGFYVYVTKPLPID